MADEATTGGATTETTATAGDSGIKFTKLGAANDAANNVADATETKKPETTASEGDKKPEAEDKSKSVSALAKLSAENRKQKEVIDRLQKDIDEKKESGQKTVELQSELDAIRKNPKLLLKYGHSVEEILRNLASEDEEDDPKYVELKARLDKKEEEERIAAEENKKASETAREKRDRELAESGHANISRFIKAEGETVGEDGLPRWAAVSEDTGIPAAARLAVLAQLDEWKIDIGTVSEDDVKGMLREYLDQRETSERKTFDARAAKLGYVKKGAASGEKNENNGEDVFQFSRAKPGQTTERREQSTAPNGVATAPKKIALEFTK